MTRYYGSKRKLIEAIWYEINDLGLNFNSVLDLFGGSATFSYYAKYHNKQVIYNDIFKFNYYVGCALIENNSNDLTSSDIESLFIPTEGKIYENIIERNFHDIYYTDEENRQIDIIVQNIDAMVDHKKRASAFYLLFQSCITKRPYNLFHRKNLNMRLNFNGGTFGNKVTWERSFRELINKFNSQLTTFCFNNNQHNRSINGSALECNELVDLVYIDPPYFKSKSNVTYHTKYHFLEGLANYSLIEKSINFKKNNKEILINKSDEFEKYDSFINDFERLIQKFNDSIIIMSYRSNGYPSIGELETIIKRYKKNVKTINLGNYGYALNKKNHENFEILIIGY